MRGYRSRATAEGHVDRDAGFLTAPSDATSSHFVRNWWLREKPKPSLPLGSHEHFTRQTIVYRIDLFPTPPPPPPRPCCACSHLPPRATPLSQPRTCFFWSSLRAFPRIQLASVYPELRGFRVQLGKVASCSRETLFSSISSETIAMSNAFNDAKCINRYINNVNFIFI